MSKVRLMHYVNQFFAGIGGEDKAEVAVGSQPGPLGPGKRLQALCGDEAEITVTVYCGDDYFAAHRDEALASILQIARDNKIQMVVAGPAFAAGRYGFACAEVCHAASASLDLPGITGMHPENAGVEIYRQHKDRRVFNFPTADSVSGMEDALSRMAPFITRLAAGSTIGPASEEGYISHGVRQVEMVAKSSAERTIDMLLDKVSGRPFVSEIPVESLGAVSPAPPITSLSNACLALVTTSGVVAADNPDGFKVHRNTRWQKYSVANLNSMTDTRWDVRHGGYNNIYMLANPNYGVPLDVCRELEKDGIFARLYPSFYTTPGINGLISVMQSLGRDMVADMKAEGVDAALLVST